MRCRVFLLVAALAFSAAPLRAGVIVEQFTSAPVDWTVATDLNYSVAFTGGDAVFSRTGSAGNGFARLTYNNSVSGDFLAAAVVTPGYTLVDGGIMALVASFGSSYFDIYIRNSGGSIQASSYNSQNGNNPWIPWAGEGTLILFRNGNNIQAGIMGSIPYTGGIPDLSGFIPLAGAANWTGSQYLGGVTFSLSFGHDQGVTGAEQANVDLVALGTPPYFPDVIPPGEATIPEPLTGGLLTLGLAGLLSRRSLRRSRG